MGRQGVILLRVGAAGPGGSAYTSAREGARRCGASGRDEADDGVHRAHSSIGTRGNCQSTGGADAAGVWVTGGAGEGAGTVPPSRDRRKPAYREAPGWRLGAAPAGTSGKRSGFLIGFSPAGTAERGADQLVDAPHVIRDARLHGRGHAQRLVYAAQVEG